jgi:hypothetical protein
MDGKCDPPSEEDPDEPRMGGIPDQVEGCEPNNHDDEDRDKEAAHWWFRELQPLRRRTRSSRHGFLDSSACKQDSRYIPVMTSIIVSVVLTLLFWLIGR